MTSGFLQFQIIQTMQQTDSWQSSANPNSESLHLMDTSLPEDRDSWASDPELFIRQNFEHDARKGCELLFRRHYKGLCSHAVRFVGSKAVAEDLVADVFCQFYEKQIFSTITTSYQSYLYTTVRNRAYNYVRLSFHRDVSLDETMAQELIVLEGPDTITEFEELHQHVSKSIESLPSQRRRIYLMYRFEGKKYKEIAHELGLSVRTIEVQIRLASHAVQAMLKSRWHLLLFGGLFEIL